MNVIFLGGIHTDSLVDYIRDKSIGPMQNAADVLQKNYIYGLANIEEIKSLNVINLPYVGSYPNHFKDKEFHTAVETEKLYDTCNIYNYSFNNVKGWKNIARLLISLKGLLKLQNKGDEYNVVCYSMHLPFLMSCYINRILRKKSKYYVIIPDLPEFMSARSGLGRVFHNIINKISYYIVNRSDGAIFITSQMADRFKPELRHVIVEGISPYINHSVVFDNDELPKSLIKKEYYLYTGTLDKRYGIRDLIDSYISSGVKDAKLVICGDGDDRSYVEKMSLQYPNIKYMGQLAHHKIKVLQKNAALLINPRSNEGEFTKYSFPSKVIEYMNSGVPILMYRLDGIPSYYNEVFFHIESKDEFAGMLRKISMMSNSELESMGEKAKEFITEQADPIRQVRKLVSLFLK